MSRSHVNALFVKHVNVAENKLKVKESSLRMKVKQLSALKEKNKTLNYESTDDNDVEISELKKRAVEKEKLEQYALDMHHDYLLLQKTADVLKSRCRKAELLIANQEEKADAKGFHQTQKTLKETLQNVAEIDEMKGLTLQEISEMVTNMTETLKVQRERLQPMVRLQT